MIKSQSLITIFFIILIGSGCSKPTDVICIPTLIYPIGSDILDNGSDSCQDNIKWTFEWSECPGATNYHIYVISENALNPALNFENLANPGLTWLDGGCVPDGNLNEWKWKVRARVDGQWGEWSEWRTFTVELPDLDC